jgi:hypothetical protein
MIATSMTSQNGKKKEEREREKRKEHWYRVVVLTHCNGEADLISISHGLMS